MVSGASVNMVSLCPLLTHKSGTKFNLPTLTSAMGFENWEAQLMSAPPYVAGAIATIAFSKLSDRFYW